MRTTPLAVLCAVAAFTLPLGAQDRKPPRIGFGVTVPDVGAFLPINVSTHLRLEPYVNFYSARADYPVTSDTTWSSSTQIGVGLFAVRRHERLAIYFGPRVGLLKGSTKLNGSGGETSTKSSGWFLAGAIGGEFSPEPRFSVGGEARIQYDHATSSSNGSTTIAPSLYARSVFSTGALVMRFYP
jgi:hypothetical protein